MARNVLMRPAVTNHGRQRPRMAEVRNVGFECHPQITPVESTANALMLAPVSLVSPTPSESGASFEKAGHSNGPAPGTETFRALVEKFQVYASAALLSRDPSELHNMAVSAAHAWKIRGSAMRRVLAIIATEDSVFKETVSDWRDSDAGDSSHSARQSCLTNSSISSWLNMPLKPIGRMLRLPVHCTASKLPQFKRFTATGFRFASFHSSLLPMVAAVPCDWSVTGWA